MKKVLLTAFLLMMGLAILSIPSFGSSIESSGTGYWDENGSWNINKVPGIENDENVWGPDYRKVDTVIINYGDRIIMDRRVEYNGVIIVYGELLFYSTILGSDGQLVMDETSSIQVMEGGNISSTGFWFEYDQENFLQIGDERVYGPDIDYLDTFPKPFEITESSLADITTVPLPVELLYFTATSQSNEILLEWASAKEWNFSHYTIERSLDGIDFHLVNEVYSDVESFETKTYEYRDKNPLPGYSYYRLKTTDIDGSFEYVAMQVVEFKGIVPMNISPNPASYEVTLTSSHKEGQLQILNQQGRPVYQQTVNSFNQHIQLPKLSAGIYMFILSSSQGREMQRVVISQ